MLPKGRRLAKEEVEKVLKTGKRFSSKYFLATATTRDVKKSSFAVVVSKKVAKNATDRNKLRRRVYSTIRPELPHLNKPVQIVIVLKKTGEKTKQSEISEDLKNLLLSMGLI